MSVSGVMNVHPPTAAYRALIFVFFPLVGVFTDQSPGVLWYGENTDQREISLQDVHPPTAAYRALMICIKDAFRINALSNAAQGGYEGALDYKKN